MKLIILIFLHISVFASNGTGGTYGGNNLTWEQIASNPSLKPVFQRFEIEGRKIPYDQLCLMGERVRTKSKRIVTNSLKILVGISVPTIEMDYLVQDRSYQSTTCAHSNLFSCDEWVEEEVRIPSQMDIPVMEREAKNSWKSSFNKKYSLPKCH